MASSICCGDDHGGEAGAPLLGGRGGHVLVEGMLNYKGTQAIRSETGRWRSAVFMIGVEMGERIAFYGIGSNLITYLTGPLHQSTAVAAVNVNTWTGVVSMLPLLGALVADSYLGRYRTILFSSLLYVLGLGLITLSTLLPSLSTIHCENFNDSCPPSQFHVILLFASLYIIAIAQGGHKPCSEAFAADQFNSQDPQESKSRSSFFNWWFFGQCLGTVLSFSTLTYIQDNVNWTVGFGVPCISMGISLMVFLLGRKTYRYSLKDESNAFKKIGLVFIVAAKNGKSSLTPSFGIEQEATEQSQQFKFLNKALIESDNQDDKNRTECTIDQVNEAKSILRLIPIWCTCLMYGVVISQIGTFFTKQGSTMDRALGSSFQVPPASLVTFTSISIVLFIPIYHYVIIPISRVFTNNPSGVSMLQRIGFGIIVSVITMVVAALVEKKRLKTASDFGFIDNPGGTIPMSIWWLLPQYGLVGVSDVFIRIGLQELFYDQVPNELKSLGIALYWSIFGVASFLSGSLVFVVEEMSRIEGGDSWFSNNINRGHLDYFYWLLAGLSVVVFVTFVHFARLYVYNRQNV